MDPNEQAVSKSLKHWLTVTACFTYVGFGLGAGTLGATMLDVKDFLNVSMVDMGYGLTIQVTACCLGSIIVSWLLTRFNRQIGLICSNLLLAVGLMSIPIFDNKVSYFISQAMIGLAYAGINNAPNALLTEIWEDKCNPFIQAMHFCYAIGAIIGPLIAEPFLASRDSPESATTLNPVAINVADNSVIDSINNSTNAEKSLVYIPYAISSATVLLAALSLIILFIIHPYKNADRKAEGKKISIQREDANVDEEPLIPTQDSKYYVTYIIVMCALLVNCDVGLEQNFFSYMQVYAVLGPLKLAASTGAYMLSAFSAAFAAGRFSGIILATKISAGSMLYLDGVIMLTGSCVILFWNTEFGLLVGSIIVGFGCSTVFPTIFAYAEERINVTTYVAGTFMFFGTFAGLIVPHLEGEFVESYPSIFSYVNLACTVPFLLFCFVLHLIDLRRERAQGLGASIIGVTMLDMKDFLNVSMVDMGHGLTILVSACCLGSIIASWLLDRFNRQIGLIFSNVLLAFGLIWAPLFANKASYFISQAIVGLAYAGINNAPNALLTEIWEDKCNPYIQAMHFCYAIGAIIGPLMAEPFLASRESTESATTQKPMATNMTNNLTSSATSRVFIPFAISSATVLLVTLAVIILSIIHPYKNANRKAEMKKITIELVDANDNEKPMKPKENSKYYVTYTIVMCALLINCDVGFEMNFLSYMQVYTVLGPLKLSASTGAYMFSAFSAAFAAGRFSGIILATKISARSMLYLDGVIMLTGSCVISLWNTEFGLWVGYVIVGFGCSTVFPTVIAYAEERINVTTYVAGTFMFFGTFAGIVVPHVEGIYVETYPVIFSYVNFACTIPFLLFCLVLHLIDLRRG
ncbi:Major facilitator superfamily domain-containing protein 4A [Halotydeus destructor]|nr:Major facilitator superfamily domain-containing protein 4A [Halotydeus destructor]